MTDKLNRPLAQQLREAADWCAGMQQHTCYSDADYVRLFLAAAAQTDTLAATRWLVTQHPRQKYRQHLSTVAMIVEAPTRAAAIRMALENGKVGLEDWFGPSPEYCAPQASPLALNKVFSL